MENQTVSRRSQIAPFQKNLNIVDVLGGHFILCFLSVCQDLIHKYLLNNLLKFLKSITTEIDVLDSCDRNLKKINHL